MDGSDLEVDLLRYLQTDRTPPSKKHPGSTAVLDQFGAARLDEVCRLTR